MDLASVTISTSGGGGSTWMGLPGPWMGSMGLSMDFLFFFFYFY